MSEMPDNRPDGEAWEILAQATGPGAGVPGADLALVLQSVPAHHLSSARLSAAWSLVYGGGGE